MHMDISYILREEDYLQFNLYVASNSKVVKRRRILSRYVVPAAYLIFALISFYMNAMIMGVIFLIFSILWVLLFPAYEVKKYVKAYKKYIQSNLSRSLNNQVELKVKDDFIYLNDHTSEHKISIASLYELVELPSIFLLSSDVGSAILIPKDQIDVSLVKQNLMDLSRTHKIPLIEKLDWKWR
ncbi:hypothetical protein GCM10022216_16740 [Sphingobacterium kyonggiense]|uniref:YcxB-like protein n=2 Tax=Sphingobacterium kyonggiense TaxID=714075 RepID=A0ABP7YP01_9SPHI